MGNNEEGKSSSKSEKSSSPTRTAPSEQTNIHVYPDWAAMQAYYSPRVALPPYYNSPMASGHPPHPYMWGPPQHMMPHYGPYAAIYSGGVYAHPAVPMGSHPHPPGVPSSPAVAAPSSAETPTKSSGNTDQSLMKKLKGFDGLAMSIGNGNGTAESADGGDQRMSQSLETEGSSDGSDGNTAGGRKRSHAGTATIGGDLKTESHATDGSNSSDKGGVITAASSGKSAGPAVGMASLDLRNPASVPQAARTVVPSEAWLQFPAANQNERELKRERRKQSNRESARRSRLRKQAETEELARKVEALNNENMALKSEITQLKKKSDQLRVENATLAEKLKNVQSGQVQEITLNNVEEQMGTADSTENLLSRVNNSSAACVEEEGNAEDRNPKSGAKLRQLLDASPRADAVPAG